MIGGEIVEIRAIREEVEAIAKWLNETQCSYTAVVIEPGAVRLVSDDEHAPIIYGTVVLS